jgi:flagellar assembly protein FliH
VPFAAPEETHALQCEAPAAAAVEPDQPDQDDAAMARAFAEGEAAGRAAATADYEGELARLRALRLNFRALDEAALGVLTEELTVTVQALCAQVLADYALDSDALAARCKAAAARLGNGWAGAVMHLHPDDATALGDGALTGWQIAPDPALERGTLVIEGPDGAVRDTPADWRRALAEALRP